MTGLTADASVRLTKLRGEQTPTATLLVARASCPCLTRNNQDTHQDARATLRPIEQPLSRSSKPVAIGGAPTINRRGPEHLKNVSAIWTRWDAFGGAESLSALSGTHWLSGRVRRHWAL